MSGWRDDRPVEPKGHETEVLNTKFLAVSTVPPLVRVVLPFVDWKITCPSAATAEVLLAERPSLRASIREMRPKSPPKDEKGWLELWRTVDGLLVMPAVEIHTENTTTTLSGRVMLDRRGCRRSSKASAHEGVKTVWQVVTARPRGKSCLFFVLLSNWGSGPITADDVSLFAHVADSFDFVD